MSQTESNDESKAESFKIFQVEFKMYKKFNDECSTADMMVKAIYDSLFDGEIPDSLLEQYYEATYGTDKAAKKKMRNRVYYIGKKIR